MIEFGSDSAIAESEIVCIRAEQSGREDYPYRLVARIKNGQEYGVDYKEKKDRDTERRRVVAEIELKNRKSKEATEVKLLQPKNGIERLERRPKRIWRQLKDLLGVKVEE